MSTSSLGGAGGAGGAGKRNWMQDMEKEANEGIQNALKTAEMSKELSLAQALAKFMKAAGDAVKASAP